MEGLEGEILKNLHALCILIKGKYFKFSLWILTKCFGAGARGAALLAWKLQTVKRALAVAISSPMRKCSRKGEEI